MGGLDKGLANDLVEFGFVVYFVTGCHGALLALQVDAVPAITNTILYHCHTGFAYVYAACSMLVPMNVMVETGAQKARSGRHIMMSAHQVKHAHGVCDNYNVGNIRGGHG